MGRSVAPPQGGGTQGHPGQDITALGRLLAGLAGVPLLALAFAFALAFALVLAGCGAAVQDRTPPTLARDPAGLYVLTVRVEGASPGVSIGGVSAVTSAGTFALAPAGGDDWSAQVPIAACVNGFDVRYEASWSWLLAGNIAREPVVGVRQKWITGDLPAGCSVQFGRRFVVDSTADLVDANPGDGICSAAGPGGPCTLRAAVMEANALRGQDRIELGGATYTLTRAGNDDTAVSGDLDILDEVTIVGNALTVISAGEIGDRVFDLSPTGEPIDLELRGLTVRDGRPDGIGGGIRSRGRLHLFGTTVRDNLALGAGGGIANDGGFVELQDSELLGNQVSNAPAAQGGGLQSAGAGARVVLRASSVTANHSFQHGGGLMIIDGRLEVRDSTLADNRSDVHGGALFANGTVRARLRNVTITGNESDADHSGAGSGGGIHRAEGAGSLRLANSVIADNKAHSGRDCDSPITSEGHNFLGSGDGCSGLAATDALGTDLSPLDPKLGTLLAIGNTRSREPLAGSPLVDQGSPEPLNDERTARCTHVDQRGSNRPAGEPVDGRIRCDIGAVERH